MACTAAHANTVREYMQRRGNARRSELNKDKRARLAGLKLQSGCVDCGYNDHPAALDFDHLPGVSKSFNLSQCHIHPWDEVLAEIAKCEVVCANCHRVRTAHRRTHVA